MREMLHYVEVLTLAPSESAMLSDAPVVQRLVQYYQVFLFLGDVAKSAIVLHNSKACLHSYPVNLATSFTLEMPGRKKKMGLVRKRT